MPTRAPASKIRALRAQLAAIAEELTRLEALPEEPPEGSVIRFNMQFGGHGTVYDYAAIRAGDGMWYTTGPRSPKGYSWDSLLEWMQGNTTSFMILRQSARSVTVDI